MNIPVIKWCHDPLSSCLLTPNITSGNIFALIKSKKDSEPYPVVLGYMTNSEEDDEGWGYYPPVWMEAPFFPTNDQVICWTTF